MHLIVVKLALEVATILPLKQPLAVLFTSMVLTCVSGSVHPVLFTLAMMLIVQPLTFILSAVGMKVGPFTIGLVILPVAHVHVSIGVNDPTEALLPVVDKKAVVAGAVRPDLSATAVPNRARPLTRVLYVIVDERLRPRHDAKPLPLEQLQAILIVPVELEQLLKLLLHNRVVVVCVCMALVV